MELYSKAQEEAITASLPETFTSVLYYYTLSTKSCRIFMIKLITEEQHISCIITIK